MKRYALVLLGFLVLRGEPVPLPAWLRERVAARDMPYWSSAFYAEALAWNYHFVSAGYFEMDDHAGQWINVAHGMRRTTGQPDHALHTLWLMGNSTLYGLLVADQDTIASYLQADLGPTYRVVNLGGTGRTTVHQLHLLETLPVQYGDLVVWLDGLMETETVYEAAHGVDELTDDVWLSQRIAEQVGPFQWAIREGYQWSTAHGAAFYHFLQPHLWSMALSDTEQGAAAYSLSEHRDLTLPRIYAALESALPTLPGSEVDLLHTLDAERAAGSVLYFDCCHLNGHGNALVAQAIWDYLRTF